MARAQPLDPLGFTSLGTLSLSGGDYTIDTDALTIVDDTAPGTPLFTGIADDQNGMAVPGVVPEIAVFTFDDIDLGAMANVTITGARAIALLSHGDAVVGTLLSVDGQGTKFSGETSLPGAGGFAGGSPSGVNDFVDGEGPGGGTAISISGRVAGAGGFGGSGGGLSIVPQAAGSAVPPMGISPKLSKGVAEAGRLKYFL